LGNLKHRTELLDRLDLKMIEATTNRAARNAMEQAHRERARVTLAFWGWLFGVSDKNHSRAR
jgi:hypothetical protein